MKQIISLQAALILVSTLTFGLLGNTALARGEKDGFIYGKVTSRSGTVYTGTIRWGTEEAFWDDLMNGNKEKLPYRKYLDKFTKDDNYDEKIKEAERKIKEAKQLRLEADRKSDENQRESAEVMLQAAREMRDEIEEMREEIKSRHTDLILLGGALRVNFDRSGATRIFEARYADIRKIKVLGSEDVEMTMKDNQTVLLSGGSNDIGATLHIQDPSFGEISLPWKKIETIEFLPTSSTAMTTGSRMFGKLETDNGTFQGYVQWDLEESMSTDKLDGESDDGKMSIAMGSIKSIMRKSSSSSRIEMKDGRNLILEGTNDVDEDNRGIAIEDARYGRVIVPWDSFEKLTFMNIPDNGPGYNEFMMPKALYGTVTDNSGTTTRGRIVYDVDEAYSWEMLNGKSFDLDYHIPFDKIKSITPSSKKTTKVEFKSGQSINLEETQDVTADNDGILIFKTEGSNPVYVEWRNLKRIDFE